MNAKTKALKGMKEKKEDKKNLYKKIGKAEVKVHKLEHKAL